MLTLPHSSRNTFYILGIDPGSNMLGIGVIEIDIETMKIVSSLAMTYVGSKLARNDSWLNEIHGERIGRITAHEENLLKIFNYYKPTIIASEGPFYNTLRPQAYGALMEVMGSIRRAIYQYSMFNELHVIPPSNVKNAVGAAGNAKKEVMKEKILGLKEELHYNGETPIDQLDEHSIDALSVCYAAYKLLLEKLCITQ